VNPTRGRRSPRYPLNHATGDNVNKSKVLLAVAVAMLAAGCTQDKPTIVNPPAASSGSPSSAAAAKPGKAPVYKLPTDMCTVANPSAFQDLYPGNTAQQKSVQIPAKTTSSAGICTLMLGSAASSLGLSVGAEVFHKTEDAKEQYDYLRKRVFADYPSAKDINGLGDGAYLFTDDTLGGVRLVVLHGNAHNSISVSKNGSAVYPADAQQRLTTVAKDMLAKMPTA
jgi:hypothetical protein